MSHQVRNKINTRNKRISVIIVQNVSAFYRYENLNNFSFETETMLQTLQPKLIKKLSQLLQIIDKKWWFPHFIHIFLYSLENWNSYTLLRDAASSKKMGGPVVIWRV